MIVKSLLDTDLYKLTMMQIVFHYFKDIEVKYKFKCRDPWINFDSCYDRILDEVNQFKQLTFTCEDIEYLRSLEYFKEDFLEYLLKDYRNDIGVCAFENVAGELYLIISGKWIETILYETPILSIINECYFYLSRFEDRVSDWRKGQENLRKDIEFLKYIDQKLKFVEFGTRRRYSFEHQDYVIRTLMEEVPKSLCGTSNVYFAKKYRLIPVGTMAHEFIEAGQALASDLAHSQRYMLKIWSQEYGTKLATALTDTLTTKFFIHDLDYTDPRILKQYTSFRQDSGCPFKWYDMMSSALKNKGAWPRTLIFSDSLDFERAYKILNYINEKEKDYPKPIVLFGIGTHLTNNLSRKALNIVIKLISCGQLPVAKLSDDPAKTISSSNAYIDYLRRAINV